jgi:hypothetical protein
LGGSSRLRSPRPRCPFYKISLVKLTGNFFRPIRELILTDQGIVRQDHAK